MNAAHWYHFGSGMLKLKLAQDCGSIVCDNDLFSGGLNLKKVRKKTATNAIFPLSKDSKTSLTILSIPLGPKLVRTASATAKWSVSALSYSNKIWFGLIERLRVIINYPWRQLHLRYGHLSLFLFRRWHVLNFPPSLVALRQRQMRGLTCFYNWGAKKKTNPLCKASVCLGGGLWTTPLPEISAGPLTISFEIFRTLDN